MKIVKNVYVYIGKPLKFKEYRIDDLLKPLGWYRIDILERKLKDKEFKKEFTKKELDKINKVIKHGYV